MNFANPHFFSAILDGIPHRFILIQESESLSGTKSGSMPRFSLGSINASRDPRYSAMGDLVEVGATANSLKIPPGYLMAHQYIYVMHGNTDANGWQYRSQWSAGSLGKSDEPWTNSPLASSCVRRRVWMTTIVGRENLTIAKRLLSDNVRVDSGGYKMQGELLRFEKGTLTKSWQRRRVTLANNRIEIYSGNTKKSDVPLQDCEVKILFENQCPGKYYAFSIRSPMGDVGVVLDCESKEMRRNWIAAIQYQMAMYSNELNFAPLQTAPPTGVTPDNRVLLCGDLMLQGYDANGNAVWSPRHFQLLPREIIYFEEDVLMGRLFVERAKIVGDNKSLNFQVESASGIKLTLSADTPQNKNLWLMGVNRQIQWLENQKLKLENCPKEELNDALVPVSERISQYYDDAWRAPPVAGANEAYFSRLLNLNENAPDAVEFTELVTATERQDYAAEKSNESAESNEETFDSVGENGHTMGEKKSTSEMREQAKVAASKEVTNTVGADESQTTTSSTSQSKSMARQTSSSSSSAMKTTSRPSSSGSLKNVSDSSPNEVLPTLNPRRSLINPKYILTVVKGVTHRFLLAMESEYRTGSSVVEKHPPRFTVGGPRASKDPRTTPVDELIAITSNKPEIQLPPGWVMMHQYINIIQQNTDDDGWQYRSNWSEGPLTSKDEQWMERYNADVHNVRRRLWMTTVVKKDDVMRAKKLVYDSLNAGPKRDVILQGNLYRYHQELGQSSTSWQRRKVLLYHNKLEFYIGNERKGEAELEGCTVKILFGPQCPARNFAFSVRNPTGTVSVLLEAESEESRLRWAKAIYYQIAILTPDVNFPPIMYGPPSGELPRNRVLFCGDLAKSDVNMHFQLKHNLLIFAQRGEKTLGRLNLEQASLTSNKEDTGNEFAIRFRSGYILTVGADSPEKKLSWVRAIRRQVTKIENDNVIPPNSPPEEYGADGLTPSQRFDRHHDAQWTAPPLDEEGEATFFSREMDKLDKLKNSEVWDGAEKSVQRVQSLSIASMPPAPPSTSIETSQSASQEQSSATETSSTSVSSTVSPNNRGSTRSSSSAVSKTSNSKSMSSSSTSKTSSQVQSQRMASQSLTK
ncbi:hypothetical protein B484DRAFT_154307 [Ochromonadaceae sp. CCMP2298]|nr:hypothetical protein B484DRAFT_154307 [Ochromonadaceae sp. CCMP2298]|mmetsp:Transcript_22330/g.49709  ORF Transcript_22330/g.49709 Transcript_22330/m.49709 type:complete len:1091 (+) Transcript_22330:143-3415(+)|eukprot:CAMPEP_0173192042 /NCGR_PEP_ID=MMETSP1141-20130122/13212_1 /TAXON_ID=483371 /ORGANISM="non described non described, Strain CCMP2298" /LENGTH=1090 /DNA_ID=CAMNT_0014116281 /DNA_START=107 /DNA_END=3379 /DNA_ORIENTATION=-